MFSFWPSWRFDAGCQAVNVVDQNVRALLEHPVALLELAVLSATFVFLVCLRFGSPCYHRLGQVCWITLFTNKPMCGSHWSEPFVRTPTLTGVIK